MLRKTICISGPEAAELFYRQDRFTRRDAAPGRIQKTLFGKGGVQALDGEEHRHRKQMFMSLMTPERIEYLGKLAADQWSAYGRKWESMPELALYDELPELLTRAVCEWAGIPIEESEIGRRAAQLTALFDYAGAVGPKHWRSRLARKQAERWIAEIITRVRAGELHPPDQSAAHIIAQHRGPDNELLSPRIAAVELLNVLRPTVAVSVFVTFAAHALHQYPYCRERLRADDSYLEPFVQEVRRFYPFFPSVIARVRRDFEWKGYQFPQRSQVVLDLYGTNRDPRAWEAPEEFRPERFLQWDGSSFNFIPQGGGDHHRGHRCPGEWITIELMKVACDFLTKRLAYDVPDQDLRLDLSRLPALPKSHFVMSNVSHVDKKPGG